MDNDNKEVDYYRQLVEKRRLDNKNLRSFVSAAKQETQKNADLTRKQRLDKQKGLISQRKEILKIAKGKTVTKGLKNAATAFTEIDLFKDALYIFIINIAILADILTLIPFAGSVFAIIFSILIWFLYLLARHFKNKLELKIATLFVGMFLEFLPFIDMLPFFTGTAIINYWIVLTDRKMKKNNN